jgi:hypothetical protein
MATSASNLNALQGYLKVVTDRQQMIVSNMANVGYARLSHQGHRLSNLRCGR